MEFRIAVVAIALSFCWTNNAIADVIEGHKHEKEIKQLAKAGEPRIISRSADCPKRWADKGLTQQLGLARPGNALCVKQLKLPTGLAEDIERMEKAQLENLSDYDERVTKLFVFRQDSIDPSFVRNSDLEKIANSLNLSKDITARFVFGFAKDPGFSQYNGLFVGDEYVEKTLVAKYLAEIFGSSKEVLTVSFSRGFGLYPGGGISFDFTFYIAEGLLVYVKKVSWDA